MIRTIPAGVNKEIRALLPMWSACMLAVVAGSVARNSLVATVAVIAYAVGSVALGAQSIGHEYSHRTLGFLLSQPVQRRRLYVTKLAVLGTMLLSLAAFAPAGLVDAWIFRDRSMWRQPVAVLPVVSALCLAPWFTMVSRSATAGVLFAISLPLLLLTAGEAIGMAKYQGRSEVYLFRFTVLWWGTLVACAVAAVAGWRTFMRLEAIEGPGAQIEMPRWLGLGAPSRAHHPVWWLVKKELHLQQMTLVMVLIYICGWAALSIAGRTAADLEEIVIPLTIIYLGLLSILIGSLASAEERQHGTLEWQQLMPMAGWQQWTVKAGVAIGLALLLGVALPMALNVIHAAGGGLRPGRTGWETAVAVILLTVSSLYVSSLCSSGVKAVVLVLPIGLGAWMIGQGVNALVSWLVLDVRALSALAEALGGGAEWSFRTYARMTDSLALALSAGYALLLLRFAFVNHRSAERGPARIVRQSLWIAGFVTASLMLFAFASELFRT